MVAGLPLGVPGPDPPRGARFRLDAEPDAAWLAAYHYRGQDRQPPAARQVLTSAEYQAFASIRELPAVLVSAPFPHGTAVTPAPALTSPVGGNR